MNSTDYALGHGSREVRRLELQAALLAPGTERILNAAGIGSNQNVLDIGTGAGDVAMLAAAIVGAKGTVLGIDPDAGVLARARTRAEDAGLSQIRYEAGSFETLPAELKFDAVIGRYVLLFQSDRAAFLRQAADHLRPGGTLIMIEPGAPDADDAGRVVPERWSCPHVELFTEIRDLTLTAFKLADANIHTGGSLVSLFHEAGLPEPSLLQDIPTGGPTSPIPELMCLLLESLLPVLEKHGVTTAAGIGLDTLPHRLQASVTEVQSQVRFYGLVGAWARIE